MPELRFGHFLWQKVIFLPPVTQGEVSEWSKEHAWKVCILQKGIEGSNPSLSAKRRIYQILRFFILSCFVSYSFSIFCNKNDHLIWGSTLQKQID